jgi:hypothetical protein
MNKGVIGIVIAVVFIIGGVAYTFLTTNHNKPSQILSTSSKNGSATTSQLTTLTACDVLTEDIAKSILGDNIDQQDPSLGSANTPDLAVSTCAYSTKITSSSTGTAPKSDGINVLARIAITQAGADSNESQFEGLAMGQQEVKNIGDKAFYAPTFRQLNVLKNNNWYILTSYKDSPANATFDTDKILAEKLHYK